MSEVTSTTNAANQPVVFAEGASLLAPVVKRRGSKYDGLLEAVLVKMIELPIGTWNPWTLESLAAAENAALHVRRMGKVEGDGAWHLRARPQEDPANPGKAILFVQRVEGPAPTRAKKAAGDSPEPAGTEN